MHAPAACSSARVHVGVSFLNSARGSATSMRGPREMAGSGAAGAWELRERGTTATAAAAGAAAPRTKCSYARKTVADTRARHNVDCLSTALSLLYLRVRLGLLVRITDTTRDTRTQKAFADLPVRIGRNPLNDLQLTDGHVSQFHAVV